MHKFVSMKPELMKESRLHENVFYGIIWLLVFLFPLMQGMVGNLWDIGWSWMHVFRWWLYGIPYLLTFLLHNHWIVKKYILSYNLKKYLFWVVVILAFFVAYQYLYHITFRPGTKPPPGPDGPHLHIVPLPVVMDTVLMMFIIGTNLAAALMFKYQRHQDYLKTLESSKLYDELKYLKAQINPHFFMNMLNNIHAMIEVDTVKAQDMILKLSHLMRYVLYESESGKVPLSSEMKFVTCYVDVMSQRYPAEKVEIILDMPKDSVDMVLVPPLLFVSFVENAFKHGISYRRKSVVDISLRTDGEHVYFRCRNTNPIQRPAKSAEGGVGLENVRRRLSLIYGENHSLLIESERGEYIVNLIIPNQ